MRKKEIKHVSKQIIPPHDEELDMLIANVEYEPQQIKNYIINLQKELEKNQAIIKGIKKFIKKYSFRNLACNPEADYYTGWNSALKEIEKTIKMLEKNIGEENESN